MDKNGLKVIIIIMKEVENGFSIMKMEQFMKRKNTNLRYYLNILSALHSWGFLFVGGWVDFDKDIIYEKIFISNLGHHITI